MDCGQMTMGTFAERAGCDRETVRYYERIGLLACPERSAAGYRLYDASQLRRLGFVLRCRQLGFPIADIRELLELVDGHTFSCAEVRAITLRQRNAVRQRLADLRRLERVLDGMAAECNAGAAPECPIIDALYR
jgi:MerR family mercuric resistance operon transcriptional regulator